MAERTVPTNAAKSKPVPPPKPICSLARTSEASCKASILPRASVCTISGSGKSEIAAQDELQNSARDVTKNSVSSQTSNIKQPYKTDQSVLCKPPLLPKPTISHSETTRLNPNEHLQQHSDRLQLEKILGSTSSENEHSLKMRITEAEKLKRPAAKIFIPHSNVRSDLAEMKVKSYDNLPASDVSVCGRAPVAKLDEFDNLCDQNPIRPPRSPKNKNFAGGPFSKLDSVRPALPIKRRQLGFLDHEKNLRTSNTDKCRSLGRSDAVYLSEVKAKSCSLEQGNIEKFKQLLESHGNLNLERGHLPVPPPRRRRKSVTESSLISETSSIQQIVSIFNLESSTDPFAPIYAQVNYSLKKNRRGDLQNVAQTSAQVEKTNSEDLIQKKGLAVSNVKTVGHTDEYGAPSAESDLACNIKNADGPYVKDLSDTEMVNIQTVKINATSTGELSFDCAARPVIFIQQDKATDDSELLNVFDKDDLEVEAGQMTQSEILQGKCSDMCTDCLSTDILEHICDNSLSSSKLDWQSVKSSLNSGSNSSSNSDIHVDSSFMKSSYNADSLHCQPDSGTSVHENDPGLTINKNESESKGGSDDGRLTNCGTPYNILKNDGCLTSDFSSICLNSEMASNSCHMESKASNEGLSSSDSTKSNIKVPCGSVKGHDKEHRRHTSLPSKCKQGKRCTRRQSWSSPTDHLYRPHWELVDCQQGKHVHSPWLDEGDLSSGALGDLDSSDNAARQSSVEDIDKKTKEGSGDTNNVSKKIVSWWGSFGKGHKKHRSNKRLSQFFCEQHTASDEQAQKCDSREINDDSTCSLNKSIPPATEIGYQETNENKQDSESFPDPANVNVDCKSEIISGNSFEIDQHSDSEIEDVHHTSNSEVNQSLSEDMHNEKKAFYIAQELMTSERVFINVLKLLNINFREAVGQAGVEQGHSVIPEADLCKIFNSLPQLQRLNEDLLRDLEQRIENWNSILKIADVIVKKGPFLKLYTTYIQNFEAQCNYFDECCQKYPRFAKVVRDFEASSLCQKLSLKHFMLKPVQRIPQYRLLLDDYSRHLKPASPDYEDTQTALRIVSDVAEHANRSIKLGDHLSKLLQLQSLLGNYEIIKPGQIVLKDGELCKLSRKDRQPRYFILLNDCLLYTSYCGSGPGSGLKVNCELPLGGMKVTTPQAEDYHNEFSIISSTRSFTVSARSLNERQEWVNVLQDAVKEYTSRQLSFQNQKSKPKSDGSSEPFKLGKEAPVWIQDGRVTKCQSCIAEFTVTFRRHHCRACGKVVCGVCSEFRAPLRYMKFQSARVCEECYTALLKEFENPENKIGDIIKTELSLDGCHKDAVESIRSQFRKLGPSSGKKNRKYVPQRLLEVTANDTGSQISGWLQRRIKRSWKRFWFVLKEQVLYVYKASEDVVALETIPVLGYTVQPLKEKFVQYEVRKYVFQLEHHGQPPLIFAADSENLASRWISAMQEAAVLK